MKINSQDLCAKQASWIDSNTRDSAMWHPGQSLVKSLCGVLLDTW